MSKARVWYTVKHVTELNTIKSQDKEKGKKSTIPDALFLISFR